MEYGWDFYFLIVGTAIIVQMSLFLIYVQVARRIEYMRMASLVDIFHDLMINEVENNNGNRELMQRFCEHARILSEEKLDIRNLISAALLLKQYELIDCDVTNRRDTMARILEKIEVDSNFEFKRMVARYFAGLNRLFLLNSDPLFTTIGYYLASMLAFLSPKSADLAVRQHDVLEIQQYVDETAEQVNHWVEEELPHARSA